MPASHPTLLVAGLALALSLGAGLATGVHAQNPFAPVVTVDERVITRHEVEQRARFLELFGTVGDLEAEAIQRLIDERLQMAEAQRMGIRLTDAEILSGMEEFAGRVELGAEEFIATIGDAGLTAEAFRDFVAAGLAWREVLRRRFAGRVTVSEADIDRALSLTARTGELRVLLSELVLPDTPDNRELAELLARTATREEFEEAARLYSAAESRLQGGRIDWVPLGNLPEPVRPVLLRLRPGQIAPPIPTQGAIILFLLRGIDGSAALPPAAVEVEYARATLPAERAEAELARLRAGADACSDFQALLSHLPPEAVRVERSTLPQVPAEIARELARLDPGEISGALRQPGGVVAVMLCARMPAEDRRPTREGMRERLIDERLSRLSDGLLAELRAAAVIRQR